MQDILSLLPLLACPVGMGLMMWLLMRTGKEQTPSDASPQQEDRGVAAPLATPMTSTSLSPQHTSPIKAIWDCVQMCLNWKVLAGLAVVGVIIWLVAPRLLLAALPVLLVLACPLSMLFMMRGMRGGGSQTPVTEQTHEEQLTELRSRLSSVQAEQEAIASRIAELESPEVPVISEAESVARAVNRRSGSRVARKNAREW